MIKILKRDIHILFQDRRLILSSTFLLILICVFITRIFINVINNTKNYIVVLENTNRQCYWYIFIFIIISYYYINQLYKGNSNEIFDTIKKNAVYYYHFMSLLILNILYSCVVLLLNVIYCIACGGGYILIHQVLKNIGVNYFLLGLVGILVGWMITYIKNKIIEMGILVAFAILISPVISYVCEMTSNYEFNLYKYLKYFEIIPRGLTFQINYYLGQPVQFNRLILILIWILVPIGVIGFKLIKKYKVVFGICMLGLCIIANYVFNLPYTKLYGSDDPENSWCAAMMYYSRNEQFEKNEDFKILKCDLKIKINTMLNATAKLYIDGEAKDTYYFTLYHEYKINKVCDKEGNVLKFIQKGDCIEVYNNSDVALEQLTFEYSGTGIPFYSDYEGIYLPSCLVFYPIAGYNKIYEDKEFVNNNSDLIKFNVELLTNDKVYSNLDSISPNTFEGEAENIMFISGLVSENIVEDTIFVYPTNVKYDKDMQEVQKEFIKYLYDIENQIDSNYSIQNKKVFVIARINGEPNIQFNSDHILVEVLYGDFLKDEYEKHLSNCK